MRTSAPGTDYEAAATVADAILYEGYLLYPYRRSSGKNRVRWQFGVLVPPAWAAAHGLEDTGVAGSAESAWQQTECLLDAAPEATVHVRLRFLQLQRKSARERTAAGEYRPVDRLDVGGRTELSFDEAVPREHDLEVPVARLTGGFRADVEVPGGTDVEPVVGADGHPLGQVVRRRWPLAVTVTISGAACATPSRLTRLRIRVDNAHATARADCPRAEVLRHSLLATHTLITVDKGRFLSLLEPPDWAVAAARECRNVHTFPVLAGSEGDRIVLSSPIILYDHPRIAPESPGDLHDATEIDEILALRTRTLSEAEKREVRATDPRAAALLDRVDSMPAEVFERLHGAIRSLRPARRPDTLPDPQVPWWEPGGDAGVSPETDSVLVGQAVVAKGSRVRLRPRPRGADAHDMFLAGRTGRVEKVLLDVDGSQFLAVTLDDDPGLDLRQWYGRLRHFRPDEVEPLDGRGDAG